MIVNQLCCSCHMFVSKCSDISAKDYAFYDELLLSSNTPVPQGWPLNLGSTVYLFTSGYLKQWLWQKLFDDIIIIIYYY